MKDGLYVNFRSFESGPSRAIRVVDGRIAERPLLDPFPEGAIDLQEKWVLPAFVDSHCHILPTGLDLAKLQLSGAETRDDVMDLVLARHRSQPDGWLLAVHYDQNRYQGVHLTRDDLDRIDSQRPILLRHVNGHASVANTGALRAAKVDEDVADPPGGSYGRDEAGRLNGLLFEAASEQMDSAAPSPTLDEMTSAILAAGHSIRGYGIGCASDMMTGRFDLVRELEAYATAARLGNPIAVRLYLQWKTVFGPRAVSQVHLLPFLKPADPGQPRIAGIKIFADGAIGSATAAIYGSYSGAPAPGPVVARRSQRTSKEGTSGTLVYSPERLEEMVRTAAGAGYQVCIHTIGDYSTDLVLDALSKTEDPSRHRIEHAMILSDCQISRVAQIGCSISFQPEFLVRFGLTYQRQLGPERAARLNRVRSVLDAGVPISFSSDRPIVSGDPWCGIRTALGRPSGFDPVEAIKIEEAIEAYTVGGSRINGDGNAFGTLEPGSQADFQVLDRLPL